MWEVKQYAQLVNKILKEGQRRPSRAGDTYSIFGETIEVDLSGGVFPLLNGRKMFYKPVLGELAAMLRGPTHIGDFQKFGCNYWNEWGNTEDSSLPPGAINVDYGNAWIDWNGCNQLAELVDKLKNNPTDRRMIISGWRPDRIKDLSLPCCHLLYQWYVREDGDNKYLDMIWYQRSVDTMVGLPSDIVLAAAWNIILAYQCGYTTGKIKLILGDTHIYANHVEPTLEYMRQLDRSAKKFRPPCTFNINYSGMTVENFEPDMIDVEGYDPMPAIKFKLNV